MRAEEIPAASQRNTSSIRAPDAAAAFSGRKVVPVAGFSEAESAAALSEDVAGDASGARPDGARKHIEVPCPAHTDPADNAKKRGRSQ